MIDKPEEILLPQGFAFSSLAAGIKASGRPDLALVEISGGATTAALFTGNRVVAAPVEVGRASLAASGGRVRALIVNSGNANCATGRAGIAACRRVCAETARILGASAKEVFPSSTGIIGVPLPDEKIRAALPALVRNRTASTQAAADFARAIMTTDTRPKIASARISFAGKSPARNSKPQSGKSITLLGVAKGAGMIHPQLATMLVYLFTDAAAAARELRASLRQACDESFNCMSIDGDTSTNDTVLLLASSASGVRLTSPVVKQQFSAALNRVCQSLAEQIISDGEGVQHVIRLHITGARNRGEALTVARTISHSLLVKTAWAGADPNWGRILAAVGRSGIAMDPSRVNILIGDQEVCAGGVACAFDQNKAHRALAQPECDVRVELGRGRSAIRFLTTDLTAEYVRINADYST
ncbi:MAG TPA: bifunctional glutamate N-acetyltransferase/amino-acid acetyltransferase ArgJ [Terriglobales bacterium]|nr:bifunctional glutamate N-acetyltransferase/amino-acid acetyltransferase ArgJ [Terriglobales bacterium]